MRTKVLLGAAVLAAGALSATAQVYSANIVGYCNVPTPVGYSFLSNPLDNGANTANVVFPNVNPDPSGNSGTFGPFDGCTIQEWTGAGWKVTGFDSLTDDTSTGFADIHGNAVAPPTLGSGKGFLFNNGSAVGITSVTFVGQVRTGTNSLVMPVSAVPYAVGSQLPIASNVVSMGFANVNPDPSGNSGTFGPLDGCTLEFLKVTPSGQAAGYNVIGFDSLTDDTSTGFADIHGNPVPVPTLSIGQGFFFSSQSTMGTYTWQQILNP